MSYTRQKVTDVTIVSGLGLAQFRDDDLSVEEPNAASTAGHKPSRRDLLEKKCSEFMATMNFPCSSKAGSNAMPPPQNAPSRRPPAQQSVGYQIEATASANTLLKAGSQSIASSAAVPWNHSTSISTRTLQATQHNIQVNQSSFNHQKHLGNSNKSATNHSGIISPSINVALPSTRIINKENEPPHHSHLGSLNNLSEVLAEMSPPKSFAQRLHEAKSQHSAVNSHDSNQWQAHGSFSSATGESFWSLKIANGNLANAQCVPSDDITRTGAGQATFPQQGSCASNNASVQYSQGDAPQVVPRIILEKDSSGSLGLLSNSVLRQRPGDCSETWLLQERSMVLHRSVVEYEDGTNLWECPEELNYTASDVPWNQEELRAAILPIAPSETPSVHPPLVMAFSPSSRDGGGDLSGEAAELAALMGDEEFGELNLEELERDEQQQCHSLPPALEEGEDIGASEMTGLYGIDEITVRESWLGPCTGTSNDREGSVRRMRVDEYLQAGSLALGSLSGHDSRPSFGLHSAPLPRSASATPQLSPLNEVSDGSIDSTSDADRQEAWEEYMKPPSPPPVSSAHSTTSSYRNRSDQRYLNPEHPNQQDCAASHLQPAPERGFHTKPPPSSDRPALAPVTKEVVGVRTRGDGGSLASACDENETAGSSTLKLDDLCTSSSSQNHQQSYMTCALKAQLGRSSSVNVSFNKKLPALNQISTYGSLGRATKAVPTNAAMASASNIYNSKSQTDVSRSSDGYQATPAMSSQDLREFLARRNLDNIRSAITDMSENITPQHARERLLHAVADDSARDATSLQNQDSTTLHDASVDIEMLRRQKELIKQKIFRHPAFNDHRPGQSATGKNAPEKRPLQESKSTSSSEMTSYEKAVGSSQQYSHYPLGQAQRGRSDNFLEPFPPNQPRSASKVQVDDLVPQRDTQKEFPRERLQQPPHSSKVANSSEWRTHNRSPHRSWEQSGRGQMYREDDGSDGDSLDDTVRLEPCSPSVTLSSSFSETLKPEHDTHCAGLEDASGLLTLSVNECGPSAGNSVCRSSPVIVEGCVVGVATWLSVPLYNPTSHYIKLWATVVNETLDDRLVPSNSSLLFKQGCLLEPGQNVVWAVGICGRNEGTLKCVLKLKLEHVDNNETLITHVVPIAASINLPQVTIGDSKPINVGQVPEGYLHEISFDVHNKSGRDLAVIINLVQTFSTSVFYFKAEANVRKISEAEIACVLTPGRSTFPLKVLAPRLNSGDVDAAKDSAVVSCKLLVKMDSPVMPRPVLASECVSVNVVAIHLHVSRSCQSLKLHAPSNGHSSTPLVLKNLSCIPLQLSFKLNSSNCSLDKESLAVKPDAFVIQPNSQSSPEVVFTPLGAVTQFTASVVIVVEPYGIEYEIPIAVSSFLAPEKKVQEKITANSQNKNESAANQRASEPKDTQSGSSRKGDVHPRPVTSLPNHIEASRSRLVFGCVDHGTTVIQKLSFHNRDNADMTLSFSINGSSSFTVVEPEKASSVVLPASGIGTLMIGFSPAVNDSAHSAVLVCKPRGQHGNRIKYSIQLQGYGGCGALKPADREVCVPRANPGCPAIVRVGLVNTGLRAICLAVRPFTDEECSVSLNSKDGSGSILVQPDELVLGAGESQDVVVVATAPTGSGERSGKDASASVARDGSGRVLLATLLITYCEELLRRRHRRRLASGCSKATAANRGSPIDWDTGIRGEKLAAKAEEDSLPSQADDGKVFLSACRQIKVPVYTSFRTASPEASVTCFSPLIPDMTLSDTALAGDDYTHSRNPFASCGGREGNDLDKPATPSVADASVKTFLFNVEEETDTIIAKRMMPPPPPPKSISGSDRSGIMNATANSTKSQGSACSSNDGVSKRVQDNVLRDSVAVVAAADNKDECIYSSSSNREADQFIHSTAINRERQNSNSKDGNYSSFPEKDCGFSKMGDRGLAATLDVGVAETPCLEVFPKELSLESGGTAAIVAVNKTKLEQTLQVVCSEPCLSAEPRVASVGPHGSISVQLSLKPDMRLPNALLIKVLCNGQESLVQVCVQQAEVQERPDPAPAGRLCSSGLEISPMALSFPIAAVGKQSHVKLSLKNLSTSVKQVLASVTPGGAFVVKHPHFQVKVGHFVNIPVYFRPRAAGEHRGRLRLVVGRDPPVEVTLSGSCV